MADAGDDSDAEDERQRAAHNDEFFAERRRERAEGRARRAEERARETPEDAARREEVMREWERGVHEANAREAEREARRREAQRARDDDKGKADAIGPADDGGGEPEAFYSADDKGAEGQDDDQEGPKQGSGERGGDGQGARRGHDRDHENPRAEDDRGWYDVFDPSSIVFNARRRVLQRKHHAREAEDDKLIPSDRREREYNSQPSAVRRERSHEKPRAEDERGWYDVFDPSSIVFNARRRVLRGGSHGKARDQDGDESEDRKEMEGPRKDETKVEELHPFEARFSHRCANIMKTEGSHLKQRFEDCSSFLKNVLEGKAELNDTTIRVTNEIYEEFKVLTVQLIITFMTCIEENTGLCGQLFIDSLGKDCRNSKLTGVNLKHYIESIIGDQAAGDRPPAAAERPEEPDRADSAPVPAKPGEGFTWGVVRHLSSKSDKRQTPKLTRMKSGKKARSKGQTSRHRKTGGNTNADPDGAKILSVAAQRNLERMGYKAWLP